MYIEFGLLLAMFFWCRRCFMVEGPRPTLRKMLTFGGLVIPLVLMKVGIGIAESINPQAIGGDPMHLGGIREIFLLFSLMIFQLYAWPVTVGVAMWLTELDGRGKFTRWSLAFFWGWYSAIGIAALGWLPQNLGVLILVFGGGNMVFVTACWGLWALLERGREPDEETEVEETLAMLSEIHCKKLAKGGANRNRSADQKGWVPMPFGDKKR